MVLDPRFLQAYKFESFIESPGYAGGFAVYTRRDSFVCTDSPIQVERVKASREHGVDTSALKVIDGDIATSWNAGDGYTQWLSFDLAQTEPIRSVRLWADQENEYQSLLRLRFWLDESAPVKTFELPITVTDGDMVEITLDAPQQTRRVEVESVRGRNWIAFREVQFLR